jgi:cobalt/nickel transport system permease protein
MHISEGVLSPQILAAGWAVAGAGIAYGLRKLDPDKIVRAAMVSSAFFLSSLVSVRIGPASTHLTLIAPMGLLLGWSVVPAIFVALILQAVLFHFGGLLVLGVNTVSIGLPALLVHLLFGGYAARGGDKVAAVSAFVAGTLAILSGAGVVGLILVLSDPNMLVSAYALLASHIPVAIIEGFITSFVVIFLRRTFPDVLRPVGME